MPMDIVTFYLGFKELLELLVYLGVPARDNREMSLLKLVFSALGLEAFLKEVSVLLCKPIENLLS